MPRVHSAVNASAGACADYDSKPAESVTTTPQEEHVTDDVSRELRYRNLPEPVAVTADEPLAVPESASADVRYPVEGPILLGQLSHFGFGAFVPEP
jgi:hypothetical protein